MKYCQPILTLLLIAVTPCTRADDAAHKLSAEGSSYQDLGQYAEAEKSYRRALAADSSLVEAMSGLASLYFVTRQYTKTEKLTLRCLSVAETPQQLGNLAALYQAERKYTQAEEMYLKALDLFERDRGSAAEMAFVLHNLGSLRMEAGKPEEAARYVERAVKLWETTPGPLHPTYAQGLAHLAYIYAALGRPDDAEMLWQQSLSILESTLGPAHPTYIRLARGYRRKRAQQYTVDYRDLLPR